jgi:hypothetical protein
VFGGWNKYNQENATRSCSNELWQLNLETRKWTLIDAPRPLPHPRRNHGAAVLHKHIYIYGGYDSHNLCLNELAIYSVSSKRWHRPRTGKKGPGARAFFSFTHVERLQGLVLFGGIDTDDRTYNDLWVLREEIWVRVNATGPVPQARYDHTANIVGNFLVIYGGRND